MKGRFRFIALVAGTVALAASVVAIAGASSTEAPPVGPLPSGPTSTIQTRVGQTVAFALPHRPNGRVWRVARQINSKVLTQVSEGDIGTNVVLLFKAKGKGTAKVSFGLTRGETVKAYEARYFVVNVK